jgi:hypothetical protein
MKSKKFIYSALIVVVLISVLASSVLAASTTKSLATNYTLVNLSASSATVTASYYLQDGSQWKAPDSFTIAGNGGQQIVRQYTDPALPAGSGSVVVTSNQALAGLVQVVINPSSGQVPSSGAYTAISQGDTKFYVPQLAKNASSATGIANSWIVVQNVGSAAVNVNINFIKYGQSTVFYTKPITGIAVGASYYYDVNTETNLTDATWYSASVEVSGTGSIAVVSNLFFGADGLMAYNGFPSTSLTDMWQIPLLYSRLANSLASSVIIQNLDTTPIAIGDVTLFCTKNPAAPGPNTITTTNTAAIPVNGVSSWNANTQTSIFPALWYGSCTVTSASGKGFVTLVQHRYIANSEMGAHEAIPGTSTDKTMFVPLVAKRLGNGFSTGIVVQNLTAAPITVDITYTRSPDCTVGNPTYTETGVAIAANGSIIRNLRLTSDPVGLGMPNAWFGTMKVVGTDAIGAYIVNSYLTVNGDRFQAYLGFTQP